MKKPEFMLKHSYINLLLNIMCICIVVYTTLFNNMFKGSSASIVNDSVFIVVDISVIGIIVFMCWKDIVNTKKLLNLKHGAPLEQSKVMTLWKRDVVPGEIVFSFLLFIVSRKKLITYFKSNGNLPANFEPEKKGIKLAHPILSIRQFD